MNLKELELELRGLMKGKFSSLHISFNADNGLNYQTVEQSILNDEAKDENIRRHRFRSMDERQEAIDTNSLWELQWYPDTPIGSYSISAPTLPKLMAFLRAEQKDD